MANNDMLRSRYDSDVGSDSDGCTLDEISKREESDVDLDLLINDDDFDTESDTVLTDNPDNDAEFELPTAAEPSSSKKKKRMEEAGDVRDPDSVDWSDMLQTVKPSKSFAGLDSEEFGSNDVDDQDLLSVGVSHDLPVGASPYEFFSQIISEDFWQTLSDETNLYAAQKQALKGEDKRWQPTTAGEMKLYVYIQFMFGIHRLPNLTNYWSTDPLLRVPVVADVMSKSRYNKLNKYFHMNDSSKAIPKDQPGYDPLHKVRPLMDMVLDNSRAHYYPGQDISIGDSMIKYKWRQNFRQDKKGWKPDPWGIKVFCAADPRTGYMLEFDVYQGRVLQPMPHGLGHHVVMKLSERFLGKGHHLYFNSFFSSVQLAQDLEKEDTYMASTIHRNRKGWPKELNAALAEKMKVGDVHFRQEENLLATLWRDSALVSAVSTNAQPEMQYEERRMPQGAKRKSKVPAPVIAYTRGVRGVDLAKQHASYYSVGRPALQWWRYVCWWLLQTAMVNAFVLWRASNLPAPKQGLRHFNFRLEVLRALCQGKSVRRRAASEVAGVVVSSPLSHRPDRLPGRKKNCLQCQKAKKRTERGYGITTVWGCEVCSVHLCKGDCFAEFHQNLNSRIQ